MTPVQRQALTGIMQRADKRRLATWSGGKRSGGSGCRLQMPWGPSTVLERSFLTMRTPPGKNGLPSEVVSSPSRQASKSLCGILVCRTSGSQGVQRE